MSRQKAGIMMKHKPTPEELEAKQKTQEKLRAQLEEQVHRQEAEKTAKRTQNLKYSEHQKASMEAWKEEEEAAKAAEAVRKERLRVELEKQIEEERERKTKTQAEYIGRPKPSGTTTFLSEEGTTTYGRRHTTNPDLIERPKLSTLGVMVGYESAKPRKVEKLW